MSTAFIMWLVHVLGAAKTTSVGVMFISGIVLAFTFCINTGEKYWTISKDKDARGYAEAKAMTRIFKIASFCLVFAIITFVMIPDDYTLNQMVISVLKG